MRVAEVATAELAGMAAPYSPREAEGWRGNDEAGNG